MPVKDLLYFLFTTQEAYDAALQPLTADEQRQLEDYDAIVDREGEAGIAPAQLSVYQTLLSREILQRCSPVTTPEWLTPLDQTSTQFLLVAVDPSQER